MITKLIFNSKDEDDVAQFKLIQKAEAMHSVLHDVAQELRTALKYGDKSDDYIEGLNHFHNIFYTACGTHGIDPYE
jgi:DNA-binding GntR family transcriptional regulator